MYAPSADFLRRHLHPSINGCDAETLKAGIGPVCVRRLRLVHNVDGACPPSVVVKAAPLGDDAGLAREQRVYADLLPRLGIPHARALFAGVDGESGQRVLILEDLAAGYRFELHDHVWSPDELRCLLRAYARLHAAGHRLFERGDGAPGGELAPGRVRRPSGDPVPGGDGAPDRGTVGLNVRSPAGYILSTSWLAPQYTTPSAARAERIAGELVKRGLLEPLPRLGALIAAAESGAARLAKYPVTLLHNDAYPPNTAMPVDGVGEAVLVDWAMAGWGFAEVDLAYLFMLPFGNTNRLRREEALACYWAQRDRIDGYLPSAGAREEAQRHADALVALGFLPLAHRAADEPFPPGTAARAYWDGMFTVLNRQLQRLSATR